MAFTLDPQVAAALEPLAAEGGDPPAVGDVATRRADAVQGFAHFADLLPAVTDVRRASFRASTPGAEIELRWFAKDGAASGPAVYYVHGGGMILGSLDLYDALLRHLVS